MASRAAGSGVKNSGGGGSDGSEDGGRRFQHLKDSRLNHNCVDQSEERRASNVEQLVRPPLPGRKAHRKTKENPGSCRDGGLNIEEGERTPLCSESSDGGKSRQRWNKRVETHGEKLQDKPTFEVGEPSHSYPPLESELIDFPHSVSLNPRFCRDASLERSAPTSPRRRPHGPADSREHAVAPFENLDPPRAEVETGAESPEPFQVSTLPISPCVPSEPRGGGGENSGGERRRREEEDEGQEAREMTSPAATLPCVPVVERRMSKRERNRIQSVRRRQRRREKWRQGQQEERRQSSTGDPSSPSSTSSSRSSCSESDETTSARDKEGFICAVCLDVYFNPYMCHPCSHIFCEPCLRTLGKNSPTETPCPLCRTVITHVFFQKELNQAARSFFPKEYLTRKQNFQKASCAKWPLPSCRKLFRIFGGFRTQSRPAIRSSLLRGGGFRLNAVNFEDESRGWRFDMDMVIIYIYSVNWVVGFLLFCFLCYLFLPQF